MAEPRAASSHSPTVASYKRFPASDTLRPNASPGRAGSRAWISTAHWRNFLLTESLNSLSVSDYELGLFTAPRTIGPSLEAVTTQFVPLFVTLVGGRGRYIKQTSEVLSVVKVSDTCYRLLASHRPRLKVSSRQLLCVFVSDSCYGELGPARGARLLQAGKCTDAVFWWR